MKNTEVVVFMLSVLTFNISPGSAKEAAAPPNLSAVVQSVLDRNPSLKISASRIRQAESGLREAKAMNWPNLSVQSSITRGDNPVYVFGSLLEQRKFGPQNFAIDSLNNPDYLTNYKNALVLGVPIFTGLELNSNEKMNRHGLEQAQIQFESASQSSRLQTIEIYLQILFHRDLLVAIQNRIESSQKEIESARKLNARGLVLGSDFFAAQAILSGLQTQKIRIEKEFESTKEQLAVLLGRTDLGSIPSGTLGEPAYTIDSETTLFSRALALRPDLKSVDEQASMATLSYKQTQRSFWPKINAYASVETNTENFSSNPSNRMIGLQSNIPIGDPAYFSRNEKARAQVEEIKSLREGTEEQIHMELAQTLRRYEGAVASLSGAKETFERADKSLELFRPLYQEGRQSIIEVLRAEEGLLRAESSYLETLFQIHSSYAQLQFVTGSLDEKVVDEINRHLEAR